MIRWLALLYIVLGLTLANAAQVGTFPLVNGEELNGEPIGPTAAGVIIKKTDGSYSERIGWTNFTQTALKKLNTTLPKNALRYIEPLMEEDDPVETTKPRAATPKLKFSPPSRMERPDKRAGLGNLFDSPLTVTFFFLLYVANIYAGYEISKFRNYAPGLVCGLAAVVPVIGPSIFLCLPTKIPTEDTDAAAQAQAEEVYEPLMTEAAAAAAAAPPPPAEGEPGHKSTLPAPVVYQRGTTIFNRRFFETKLAGFLRVVPGEAEKDMLISIKSARGDFIGSRLSKVLPNEICLLEKKGEASSEVIIPYAELLEVKIRHKDDV